MSVKPLEEKLEINRALEMHNGDRKAAAAELGITYVEIKNRIYNCPSLSLRWRIKGMNETVEPLGEVDMIYKPPVPIQEQIGEQLAREDDAILRDGLSRMGLLPDELELAMELQNFNRNNFSRSLDIVSAGVTRQGVKIMTQLGRITDRLDVVRGKIMRLGETMDEERMMWVEEEMHLATAYRDLNDQLRKMMGVQFEATKTLAYIKYNQKSQKKNEKPSFSSAIPV